MKNHCINCGAPLPIINWLCPICGHNINNSKGPVLAESRKPAYSNQSSDSYDFKNGKQKRSRKFSFFGFFIWILALFIIAYLVYYYAMPNDEEQYNDINTALLATKKDQIQASTFFNIPEKLAVEQQRTVKNDSILILYFKASGIPLKDEYSLVEKLFPYKEIEPGDASEKFTAYNVTLDGKYYNIIVTYGELQGGFVIDKLYFSSGEFRTDNIGDILF